MPRDPVARGRVSGARAPRPSPTNRGPPDGEPPVPARERFLRLDRYRVEREWKRYEGTAQRDLFRQLRERFLIRHSVAAGRTLEIGPGPGRFSPLVGAGPVARVLLELSMEMLRAIPTSWPKHAPTPDLPELVQGDAVQPPFRTQAFDEVVALGNPLGFAEEKADEFLGTVLALVAPGGRILLEAVSGPGERSTYLYRLPPGAVRRLLAAPVRAVVPRVEREGFRAESQARRDAASGFRRFSAGELIARLERSGFAVAEAVAVAPCLGADPARVEAIQSDPNAWAHLLEVEETIGRDPARQDRAAALLLAAVRTSGGEDAVRDPGGPGAVDRGTGTRGKRPGRSGPRRGARAPDAPEE